jgi:carbon monoxide dehydrogenase subunit G
VQLEHSFTVPVGIEDAWRVLLDIELIASCMPGAGLDSVDGDDFTGIVKVKLGPIGLTYKGRASWVEKDAVAHRAVIDARGRDARGNGTANAKVTATLTEAGGSTDVNVITDLDITGKPAQFGRGVMADVGNKLIGQFADCLAGKLTAGGTATASAAAPPAPASTTGSQTPTPDEPTADAKRRPQPRPRKAAAKVTAPATAAEPAASEPATRIAAEVGPPAPAAGAATAAVPGAEPTDISAPVAAEPPTRPVAAVPSTPRPAESAQRAPAADVEPINLIESAGPAVLKRLAPLVLLVIVALLAMRHHRSRR